MKGYLNSEFLYYGCVKTSEIKCKISPFFESYAIYHKSNKIANTYGVKLLSCTTHHPYCIWCHKMAFFLLLPCHRSCKGQISLGIWPGQSLIIGMDGRNLFFFKKTIETLIKLRVNALISGNSVPTCRAMSSCRCCANCIMRIYPPVQL